MPQHCLVLFLELWVMNLVFDFEWKSTRRAAHALAVTAHGSTRTERGSVSR